MPTGDYWVRFFFFKMLLFFGFSITKNEFLAAKASTHFAKPWHVSDSC